jgi:GAF domain-containing protein
MASRPADGGHPAAAGESLQQLLDTSAALRRVAALVARGASPSETFSAVAHEVAQLLGVDVAAVLRFEPDGTVAVAGWWGLPGMDVPVGTELTIAGEAAGMPMLRNGRPVRIDRFGGPVGSVTARLRRLGLRSPSARRSPSMAACGASPLPRHHSRGGFRPGVSGASRA